jgi:cbb3-type cytochrome oxidase subunit 3
MKGIPIVFALLLIACLASVYAAQEMTRANEARIAEAATDARAFEAIRAQAEATRAEAEKERPVYEAIGHLIASSADLNAYYATRGDARAREAWQWLVGLALCAGIVWYALRAERQRRLPQLDAEAVRALAQMLVEATAQDADLKPGEEL